MNIKIHGKKEKLEKLRVFLFNNEYIAGHLREYHRILFNKNSEPCLYYINIYELDEKDKFLYTLIDKNDFIIVIPK